MELSTDEVEAYGEDSDKAFYCNTEKCLAANSKKMGAEASKKQGKKSSARETASVAPKKGRAGVAAQRSSARPTPEDVNFDKKK